MPLSPPLTVAEETRCPNTQLKVSSTRSSNRCPGRQHCRRETERSKTRMQSSAGAAAWRARHPNEVLQALRASKDSAVALMLQRVPVIITFPQLGLIRLARAISEAHANTGKSDSLHRTMAFLLQPLGGQPVSIPKKIPGWHIRLSRGPPRWLGLRPGKPFPVLEAGPWWTPSGALYFVRSAPAGVWLLLLLWLCSRAFKWLQTKLQARRELRQQQELVSAAKASDLLLQRNRMLRAFGGGSAEEEEEEEKGLQEELEADSLAPETQGWQDPSEWDTSTRKQWDSFMRKSKALRIQKERWWDIDTVEDIPHFKTAAERLKDF